MRVPHVGQVGLFVLVSCAFIIVDRALSVTQTSFVIRSRQITDVPEALKLLRQFIKEGPDSPARCEKYAVLLSMLTSSYVDQFAISELGLANKETVRPKLKLIDVETLRQLYIDGIKKLLEGDLDPSILELVDCLTTKFKNIDAKARSFLNNIEFQETISQYKSILDMPLDFLLYAGIKHPTLTNRDLKAPVRRALLRLFDGNSQQVEVRFSPTHRPLTFDFSNTNPGYTYRGVVDGWADANTFPPATVVGENSRYLGPNITPDIPLPNQKQVDEPGLSLTDDEQSYLNRLIESLKKIHQLLISEPNLNDRCQAYIKIIEANHDELDEKFVDGVAKEVLEKKAEKKEDSKKTFLPDKTQRENLLFIVTTLKATDLGDEGWIDMVDCVSQWEATDPEVRLFLNSGELAEEFEKIMKHAEEAASLEEQKLNTKNVAPPEKQENQKIPDAIKKT